MPCLSTGPEGALEILADMVVPIDGVSTKICTSRLVALESIYDGDAALMKISDEPSFLNKSWEPVISKNQWTFESDGQKTLYVKYSDLNGLESSPYSVSFIVDSEKPVLETVSILNDWTQSGSVNIYINTLGTDTGAQVKEIMFGNDEGFTGGVWVAYADRLNWTVVDGFGSKTVLAKIRDFADRESAVGSDEIEIGAETIITIREYSDPITLLKEQSPYLAAGVVFDSDLEIEGGVVVNVVSELVVKGALIAKGTSADRIKIGTLNAPTSGANCSGSFGSSLILSEAKSKNGVRSCLLPLRCIRCLYG